MRSTVSCGVWADGERAGDDGMAVVSGKWTQIAR